MSGRPSVLLVEDNIPNIKMLEAKLRLRGFEVTTAMDGDEAMRACAAQAFDVVLLDIMLPRLDGFEVCRQLKARPGGCRIIMITALDQPADRLVGLAAGADDYFVKPVEDEVLFARIESLVHAEAGAPRAATG
jgi:two-component system cell cycle response regulator